VSCHSLSHVQSVVRECACHGRVAMQSFADTFYASKNVSEAFDGSVATDYVQYNAGILSGRQKAIDVPQPLSSSSDNTSVIKADPSLICSLIKSYLSVLFPDLFYEVLDILEQIFWSFQGSKVSSLCVLSIPY
jgi:hypothetical protein